ncbi:Dipeptidyl-peptidase 5 [Rhodotorula toruloides]|nr:Dipeptidyl-peptidase 5 [Rhodotorula toruloides]
MTSLKLSPGSNITPKDILALPRPDAGVANPSGSLALWPSTEFDFDKRRTERSIFLVEIEGAKQAGASAKSSEDFSSTAEPKKVLHSLASTDAAWLDDRTIAFLRPAVPKDEAAVKGEHGERVDHPKDLSDDEFSKKAKEWSEKEGGKGTEVWAKDVDTEEEYCVGKFPVSIGDLTITHLSNGDKSSKAEAILAFSATVFPDGDIFTVHDQEKKLEEKAAGSDALVYDELFVRHWDAWKPTAGQKKQLHFVRLSRASDADQAKPAGSNQSEASLEEFELVEPPKGRWSMQMQTSTASEETATRPEVFSPLKGTPLECPVGPFGGASDFSFSAKHLLFHAKDPHLNPAWHTRTQVYLVPLSPRTAADAEPRAITVGTQGACSSPVLSPDGKRAAWLEMREDGYEADRNRVMIFEIESGKRWEASGEWDRSPSKIIWAPKSDKLFLEAEDQAHVKVFELDLSSSTPLKEPVPLTTEHAVAHVSPLSNSSILLTWNSHSAPNQLSLLSVSKSDNSSAPPSTSLTPLASLTKKLHESKSLSKGEDFWFAGDKGHPIHGWILFPPEVEKVRLAKQKGESLDPQLKDKKWPLAFLAHGGPQSAWTDSWSTRWNPNSWAGHGYITVLVNRTGSTGFGQAFCDAIKHDWGGAPFRDLVAGLEFVKKTFPEIDGDRTAALGASFGGFMMNWMEGHNDQLGFKCFVNHDGAYSTSTIWAATEELYFPEREFGGTPWESPEIYQKWDPSKHVQNWKTPMLVIHGSKDYRLTESETLAAFNALQRQGIPSRLLVFPSENHFVLNPSNAIKWNEEILRFIDEWTAPADGKEKSGYDVKYASQ